MLRVWWRMPGTSEARKNSPSPRPRTTGGPMRAATILSGSCGGEDADGEGAGEAADGAADGFFERELATYGAIATDGVTDSLASVDSPVVAVGRRGSRARPG